MTSETSSIPQKLAGYDFYHQVLKSPKYVVAPMVDQSELAWRILSRRHGAQVTYTPMINAKRFADVRNKTFRELNFNLGNKEEGSLVLDRPLIIQFCGDDPEKILEAAKVLEPHCDAIDINLGCPQDIAKRGHYGAFLQDDWDLIYRIINTLHRNLQVPVTAKFRVFPSVEKTVEYAKMLENAGAQILTCHGRTREQRGVLSGLADWTKIKAVKEAVSVPVFANGNILYFSDIQACLDATGADAVMSAEGNLYNPALFRPALGIQDSEDGSQQNPSTSSYTEHVPHTDLALEYLEIVKSLKTPTGYGTIKGHLFKLLRPGLATAIDLRDRMGKGPNHSTARAMALEDKEEGQAGNSVVQFFEEIVNELKGRMESAAAVAEGSEESQVQIDSTTGLRLVPPWLSQPYFRPPLPPPPSNKRAKKDMIEFIESRRRVADAEEAPL
ncbi:hypothetical protein M408DRAFT_14935 [Serendipita vermifera MAFF 305830]|uniref:tRNA-dihydrouridine(16/17) synthase [NAD(P)(+)] n=1 Tax=Serendipita vermifera MAFF 305830 TaxID=933852 RepID=A0A0C2X0R6_SERVB|nr:hypothetical protein M408DRAFT_14935 [Serendipita vermifera MAFF 305830]